MRIRFWGVRGSIPSPLSSESIQSKIATVLQRARPEDLTDAQTRERFLALLPDWLFGTTGGNTACIEVRVGGTDPLILDAGSGVRTMGARTQAESPRPARYHIFFSHFHWDHLQGLPFFAPLFDDKAEIDFYSPEPGLEGKLRGQMSAPYFPIPLEGTRAQLRFHETRGGETRIGNATIAWRTMNHPGGCYAYRVSNGTKSVVYATDAELLAQDFEKTDSNKRFFDGVNVLILDSQYTLGEAVEKYNWGHSSFSLAVDFATTWGIETLFLFHHEPSYDDRKLHTNLQSARWYSSHVGGKGPAIRLAVEGYEHVL